MSRSEDRNGPPLLVSSASCEPTANADSRGGSSGDLRGPKGASQLTCYEHTSTLEWFLCHFDSLSFGLKFSLTAD